MSICKSIARILGPLFVTAGLCVAVHAAEDPVQWTLTIDSKSVAPGGTVLARLTAEVQEGWHVYSLTTPKGGPNPTTARIADNPAVASVRIFQPKPVRQMDPNFGIETETFEKQLPLLLVIAVSKDAKPGPVDLTAQVRYQCCSSKLCLPPRRKTAQTTLTIDASAKTTPTTIPAGYTEVGITGAGGVTGSFAPSKEAAIASKPPTDQQGLFGFLIVAFGFGLAAIFTPCVFPMIPITVSFFLNQNSGGSRRGGLSQAVVFCLGIVVLFTGLGLLMKAIAGPFGVVLLGSNPWVNGFITLVFIVFGLSLLGAFELTLPSGLLTRLDQASRGGGYVGTLIMGLTFSLTSFACVGPIVGPLIVASVTGNSLQPVLGMICFASGLALPFFLLALFPSYLQKLPRSGGWMSRVKVVLGLVVLACALKYLGNVDQVLQLGFLTRARFLAAWIVLFSVAGLYLLGLVRLEGIKPDERVSVSRALGGIFFLVFSISLLPGLFGAPLGELDAYVPAPSGSNVLLSASGAPQPGLTWLKNKYEEAAAQAAKENKLVFVNFTGYACTNCHWMKANMFTRPDVQSALQNYVLVNLFTDGTDAESEKNQNFENKSFSTVAIPFYAVFDARGKVLATFPGLTRNPIEFISFLKSATDKATSQSNLT